MGDLKVSLASCRCKLLQQPPYACLLHKLHQWWILCSPHLLHQSICHLQPLPLPPPHYFNLKRRSLWRHALQIKGKCLVNDNYLCTDFELSLKAMCVDECDVCVVVVCLYDIDTSTCLLTMKVICFLFYWTLDFVLLQGFQLPSMQEMWHHSHWREDPQKNLP